jgi:hypothetical protein
MKRLWPLSLTVLVLCVFAAAFTAQTQLPRLKGRALLVGINQYALPANNLTGAVEDALALKDFIQQKYGFAPDEIHTLLNAQATRQNILNEFRHWLIEGSKPGERVFFLFSGHGSHLPDDNGDEDDKVDETLAPHDVTATLANQIRDDELNALIKQLAGRTAVLLFDSCHSGTVARDLSTGGAQARLLPLNAAPPANARGTLDTGPANPRGLRLVEPGQTGAASGVVVISAASPEQKAFTFTTPPGAKRGALSYFFTELQKGREPTVRQLREELRQRLDELYKQKRIPEAQSPHCEILAGAALEDLPLFSGAQAQLALPVTLLANPLSSLRVTVRTADTRTSYRFGQRVSYELNTNAPGYLYLLVFSQGEVAACLFPNRFDGNNQLSAGTHRFPRVGEGIEVGEPAGKDVVVALLSNTKLDLGEKENYTWNEVFARLQSRQLTEHVKSRGQMITAPTQAIDWQAASLVLEAVR